MSSNHETADAWMNVPKAPGGRLELGRFADPFYSLGLPISMTLMNGVQKGA